MAQSMLLRPGVDSWHASDIAHLLSSREVRGPKVAIHRHLHGHPGLLRRFKCSSTLEGHHGCVNHLRWNQNGTLLASGSDDTKLIVWDYATKRAAEVIDTGHVLNIFAVCFVPGTNDHVLATGAMDKDVRIHYAPFHQAQTKRFHFHRGRVKDIASSPLVPRVFWSVAEDGLVYQFDLRALPPGNGIVDDNEASGVLIRLGKDRSSHVIRGMAMAVHPLDATKLVVACGDFYTRMYDRRMLRTREYHAPYRNIRNGDGELMENVPPAATIPVEVFAPPHLHLDTQCDFATRCRHDEAHGTSIQFNSDGSEILANYHNDHIYLFHTQQSQRELPTMVFKAPHTQVEVTEDTTIYGLQEDQPELSRAKSVEAVRMLSSQGLVALLSGQHSQALTKFAEASKSTYVSLLSDTERKELYHDMAKAYLGRKWRGDDYLACVHARLAQTIDSDDHSVELTYIRALHASKRTKHVIHAAKQYQSRFPAHREDVEGILQEVTARHRRNHSHGHSPYHFVRRSSSSSSDDGEHDDEDEGEQEAMETEGDSSDGHEIEVEEIVDPIHADNEFWVSEQRHGLRVNCDVQRRFIGYCNLQTDIKEANFFGPKDACIVAGSDDGRAYIWDKHTGCLVNAIEADADIVNCVQPHPFDTCLATSGIENVVRLWTPTGDENDAPSRAQLNEWAAHNQAQMVESSDYYVAATNPNIIRLIFQASENEGYQECATS